MHPHEGILFSRFSAALNPQIISSADKALTS